MTTIEAKYAEIYKVQTLADNGIRLTINLPETETEAAYLFMECHRWGRIGKLIFEIEESENDNGKLARY